MSHSSKKRTAQQPINKGQKAVQQVVVVVSSSSSSSNLVVVLVVVVKPIHSLGESELNET